MGKRPSRAYVPQAGSSFNVIMSIQYRGWKENQFPHLMFSSNEGVRRAMNTLQLTSDLSRLNLPGAVKPEQVYRSSYGYANTIEILFPNCEGKGVIEQRFRSLNRRLQVDASELESMQIRTLYSYFLQKHILKLDENSPSTFVFRRPLTGWPRHPSSLQRARTPPRMPRAWHRTPSPSSLRDSVHGTNAPDDDLSGHTGTSAQPVAASSSQRSTDRAYKTADDLDMENRRTSAQSRCREDSTSEPDTLAFSATHPSVDDTVEIDRHAPPVFSQADEEPDPHRDEREALRKQIEQCETQRQLQRKRIRELQQELSSERDARQQAEVRLEEERGLLERERRKLREMRRECSEPFVTPALLDAFQEVSAIARAI
ncbi:hypothetical protein PENSPDRAFT_750569 [Peniophora sp. CONT]|nr:hypothetical protein PENSPDRAFT_750569 [Peniophora sp. CONT]